MPVQYQSVLTEHKAVRGSAGVFDVSHLGRFRLTGTGAHEALRRRLCNDVDRIEPGRCQYTMILNEEGGIVDDLIVWWLEEGEYWVMPNAANHERVMAIFDAEKDSQVTDLQGETVFLAVQGPEARAMIESVVGVCPGRFRNASVSGSPGPVTLAGTGYTGEEGAEICVDPATGEVLMEAFLGAGAVPCGLGARDTLRLEAGLPLWGEDIDETTTPLEADLGFAVAMDHEFVGRSALEHQERAGLSQRLAGFVLAGKGIPRHGHRVRTADGGEGAVTSGNLSPMLGSGVGLAYLSPPADVGDEVEVSIRERWVPGQVAKAPFHR